MKIVIPIFIIVSIAMYFLIDDELIAIISDVAGVLFFAFSTVAMVSISSILAIETAKVLKFKTLDTEYEALKVELHSHITRNCFSIEITKEANLKHNEYKKIEEEISRLKKGDYYEN